MEAIVWPLAFFAVLCALTPTGIALAAVPFLRNKVPNALMLCVASTFICWVFAALFTILLPYVAVQTSTARVIGILLMCSFGTSFIVTMSTYIPFVEEDEHTMYGYEE